MKARFTFLFMLIAAVVTIGTSDDSVASQPKYRFPELNFTDYVKDPYNETKLYAIHDIVQHRFPNETTWLHAEDIPDELQPI